MIDDIDTPEGVDAAYLATDDVRAQCGFRGSAERWAAARRLITRGIDAPGTLLDVGCANGHLMESLVTWSAHAIEAYGVDFAPRLVELARRRLARSQNRIWLADIRTWKPSMAFDYVHIRLDTCELRDARAFGRRVIVSSDGSFTRPDSPKASDVAAILHARGWQIAGAAYERSDEHRVELSVAWT